jgi:hypothetical protein
MHRPLEHVEEILGQFVDFPSGATDQGLDLLTTARSLVGRYKSAVVSASTQELADPKTKRPP